MALRGGRRNQNRETPAEIDPLTARQLVRTGRRASSGRPVRSDP